MLSIKLIFAERSGFPDRFIRIRSLDAIPQAIAALPDAERKRCVGATYRGRWVD